MKKIVSMIIIFGLLFCSLCCFTACGNEKADSNQNSNQGGVSLPESINTNGTPACAVTKVWFEEGPSGSLIQFEFSDRNSLGEVDVMYTDIYNSETNKIC